MMLIRSNISPINVWIITLVITLHGLTMWAVASVDSPKLLETETIKPQVIQLELVTLPTSSLDIKPNSKLKPEPGPKIQPEKQAAKPVDRIKPTLKRVEPVASVKRLTRKPEVELLDSTKKNRKPQTEAKLQDAKLRDTELKESKLKESKLEEKELENDSKIAEEIEAPVSTQVLIIKETKMIIRSNATDEVDLEAMIRAVTAQYNRDQARQRLEGSIRDTQKRLEDNEDNKKTNQSRANDVDTINFLEERASWLNDIKPTTDLPLAIWLSTAAQSGDTFIVIVELHVDKMGVITEVALLETSGNQIIDVAAMIQVRAGQLKPFQQEGLVVDGIVPMTLVYVRP